MGYRSNVKIRTTEDGYEKMKKYIKEQIKGRTDIFGLFEGAKVEKKNDFVDIEWADIKWYEEYIEVSAIMNSLDKLSNEDIDYQFIRIGENLEDIEEIWNINNDSFDSFWVSRTFEG